MHASNYVCPNAGIKTAVIIFSLKLQGWNASTDYIEYMACREITHSQQDTALLAENSLWCVEYGSPTWARTRDKRINSPLLYQLSYRGIDSAGECPLMKAGMLPI